MKAKNHRQTILICEDCAHLPTGHWGVRFAELAEGFVSAGYDVHVLISSQWVYEDEFPMPHVRIHRYNIFFRGLFRFSENDQNAWVSPKVRMVLRHFALAYSVGKTLTKLNAENSVVISVGTGLDPYLLAVMERQYNWVVHMFDANLRNMPNLISKFAQFQLRRRSKITRRFIAALPDPSMKSQLEKLRPALPAVVLRLAGATNRSSDRDAREMLGIPKNKKVALLFGSYHDQKLPHVAIDAARQLADWTLYVVGEIAEKLSQELTTRTLPENIILKRNAISYAERLNWHCAADLSILSFKAGYRRNSGTLMDALSAGHPVVVSDFSFAADLTKHYSLGEVFAPNDVQSLVDAVNRARPLSNFILDAAMADLSNRSLADQHIKLMQD